MTPSELKKLLAEAEQDPKRLAAAVSGVPETILRSRPAPGKWCIQEIVGHLADSEIVFAHRIRQVLADKEPKLVPFGQDAWTEKLGYLEASIPELVAQFGLERHHNLRVLRRVQIDDLNKSGFHMGRNQQLTLEEIISYWACLLYTSDAADE